MIVRAHCVILFVILCVALTRFLPDDGAIVSGGYSGSHASLINIMVGERGGSYRIGYECRLQAGSITND